MTSFKSAAQLEAHYAATKARLWGKYPPKTELSPLKPNPPDFPDFPIVKETQRAITTLDRLRGIAKRHGFTLEDLRGPLPTRSKAQVAARREIMKFLSDEKRWSKNRIARMLDIDHTSVIHGLDKIREDDEE